MKTYARGKTSAEFVAAAQSAGLTVNTAPMEMGGDWLVFNGTLHGMPVHALFSVVNSRVIGTFGADKAGFSSDDSLDGTPWFDALLDLANTNDPRPIARH
jgi:hypothetical protein